MASRSRTRGNAKRTKSDKKQPIVPQAFHSNGQHFPPGYVNRQYFPPGYVPYGSVPFPQPSWQGNASVPGYYPQMPRKDGTQYILIPPGWNNYHPRPPTMGPTIPSLGTSIPNIPGVVPQASPSPPRIPVIPEMVAPWIPESITSEPQKRALRPPPGISTFPQPSPLSPPRIPVIPPEIVGPGPPWIPGRITITPEPQKPWALRPPPDIHRTPPQSSPPRIPVIPPEIVAAGPPWIPGSITPEPQKRALRPPPGIHRTSPPPSPPRIPPEMVSPGPPWTLGNITPKPPPSTEEYLAGKLVENPLGLTNVIPREETTFHNPLMWNSNGLKENVPASPPSAAKPLEDFTAKLELKPTFSSHIVRTPAHYVPVPQSRQTKEPTPSPSVHSTSDKNLHSPLILHHSRFIDPPTVPRRSTSNSRRETFRPPRSISQNGPSIDIIPPQLGPSATSAPTTKRTRPQRKALEDRLVELPSTNHEAGPKGDSNNHAQLPQVPAQNPGRVAAPWILASRESHAPKKPVDVKFIARMADLRQKINGTSSTSSTPQARQSLALLGSPVSLASSAFSQSFSIMSQPPSVEFSPTPVFTDEIPEGFTRKLELLSVAQTPVPSALNKPRSLQNSHPDVPAIQSLNTIHEVAPISSSSNSTPRQQPTKLPASTSSVRRGYWNRRGDHLTPEGYLVFPPKNMQYPDDLKTYPFEHEGYRDHSGAFTAHARRPELPQSLPKQGNPPERPYESFVVYV